MDAKKLASLLRGGHGGPLVIDSRSFVEYNRGHVLSSVNICCSKLVKRRLQQGKVTISELIQPAVHSQVLAPLPLWPGPARPQTDRLPTRPHHPHGPRLSSSAMCTGALGLASLPFSALEPELSSAGSECLQPFHISARCGAAPTPPRVSL